MIEALEGPIALAGGKKKRSALMDSLILIEGQIDAELKKVTFDDLVMEKLKQEKVSLYSI